MRIATGFSDFLQEGLEGGKLDICLMGDYLQSELLQTSPVYSEPIYVFGMPGSGLSQDTPMTLEAVSRMPMVVPEARSLRNVIDRACTILGVNLNLVAESDSTAVILDLVLRGVGYTILPAMPIMTMLAEKRIEGAPIISPTLQRTVIIGTAVLNRNPRLVNVLHAELIRLLEPYIKQFDHVGARWLAD